MKTTHLTLILAACCAAAMTAQTADKQTAKKQATVHIKKTTVVNGVEKTTDTTYTTSDLSTVDMGGERIEINEFNSDKDGKQEKITILSPDGSSSAIVAENGQVNLESQKGKSGSVKKIVVISNGKDGAALGDDIVINETDGQITIGDMKVNVGDGKGCVQTMVVNTGDGTTADGKAVKKEKRITIIRKVNITEASDEDLRLLNKQAGQTDGKLSVEKMDFYPNPTNGHFNLSFSLPDKGDTEVKVMDMKGALVYSESLKSFTGNYSKEVDISNSPKGVYFVRVEQGKHALVKKIVVD